MIHERRMSEASRRLQLALRVVRWIAVIGMCAAVVPIAVVWFSWGPVWALFFFGPTAVPLVVLSLWLRRRPDDAPGASARAAVSWVLGSLALVVDWGTIDSLKQPQYSGAVLTLAAMCGVRVARSGRASYLVPCVVSSMVVLLMMFAEFSMWYLLVPLLAALLLYSGCMVFVEYLGRGDRSSLEGTRSAENRGKGAAGADVP